MALLDADVIVADQVTSVLSVNAAIRNGVGAVIGRIVSPGSASDRFFRRDRRLTVLDGSGDVCFAVDAGETDDVAGQPALQLNSGDGRSFATVINDVNDSRARLVVNLVDGRSLELTGSWREYEFLVAGVGRPVAQVSRRWPGLAAGLLGPTRYVVAFGPAVDGALRCATLGATVAIDLIRAGEVFTA